MRKAIWLKTALRGRLVLAMSVVRKVTSARNVLTSLRSLAAIVARRVSTSTLSPLYCHSNTASIGHVQNQCTNARAIDWIGVDDVAPEEAWKDLTKAIYERDTDDCRIAIKKYIKKFPEMTYVQLQAALYEQNMKLFLIPLEKKLAGTLTNMDLQGNLGKKYTISYRFEEKASRPREAEGWPQGMKEILERLTDAGEPVSNGLSRCTNCGEFGSHISKNCPQEKAERTDRAIIQCINCEELGHRVRDCTKPRKGRFACKNCGYVRPDSPISCLVKILTLL
jgi:Zinc knuckle